MHGQKNVKKIELSCSYTCHEGVDAEPHSLTSALYGLVGQHHVRVALSPQEVLAELTE